MHVGSFLVISEWVLIKTLLRGASSGSSVFIPINKESNDNVTDD